jgi:type II secretory pathway pseudopilin PulG
MSALRPARVTRQPSTAGTRRNDRSGFALVDVLVAIAVLAVLGAMLPRSIVATRHSVERAEAWFQARLVAETLVARELSGNTIRSGKRSGRLDGRHWTISSTSRSPLPSADFAQPRRLLEVRLTVEVSATETLVVDTLRIGVAP